MQVEDIASWVGEDVVDGEDAKIGRLHEVYTEIGGSTPVIGSVKVGRIAGKTHLVPLTEAVFSRGQVRVPFPKDLVAAAPEADDSGQLSGAEEIAFAQHYGLTLADGSAGPEALRYESSTARAARAEAMGADLRRAEEMEAEADRLGAEADELDARAAEATQHARANRERQQQLATEAGAIRRSLDGAPPV